MRGERQAPVQDSRSTSESTTLSRLSNRDATVNFDVELAKDLAAQRDRDVAPFFARRTVEIERFDGAFRELRSQPGGQAAFRICQGPPGCGKTSLLHRLKEKFADRALFVELKTAPRRRGRPARPNPRSRAFAFPARRSRRPRLQGLRRTVAARRTVP